jgi:hypothetical protein
LEKGFGKHGGKGERPGGEMRNEKDRAGWDYWVKRKAKGDMRYILVRIDFLI